MPERDLTIEQVLQGTGGELLGSASPEQPIRAIRTDSRAVEPGALFVALRGQKHDGHDFVVEAFARGAAAALVERVPGNDLTAAVGEGPALVRVPSTLGALADLARSWLRHRPLQMAAVVGSIGKETTADLIAAVLGQRFGVAAVPAVRRLEVELPLALLGAGPGAEWIVVPFHEFGPEEARFIGELSPPTTVVVTNLEPTHDIPSEALNRFAGHVREMLRLLTSTGTAVLNGDDTLVGQIAEDTESQIRFGITPDADVRAEAVVGHGRLGLEFDLVIALRRVRVRLPLFGLYALHGALAAAAVGLAHGLELREVGAGLQTALTTVRIVVATGVNGSRIIDDSYNGSPESDLEALNLLAGLDGRKVAVLGDMLNLGSFEVPGHCKVGNRAARVVDELVTIGERARLMADEARRVGLSSAAIYEAPSAAAAAPAIRRRLRPGDYVLVKGAPEMGLDAVVRALRVEG